MHQQYARGVFTFLGTAVLVVGWGQLLRVDVVPDENWGTVWAVMSFVYIAAYLVA